MSATTLGCLGDARLSSLMEIFINYLTLSHASTESQKLFLWCKCWNLLWRPSLSISCIRCITLNVSKCLWVLMLDAQHSAGFGVVAESSASWQRLWWLVSWRAGWHQCCYFQGAENQLALKAAWWWSGAGCFLLMCFKTRFSEVSTGGESLRVAAI